MFDDKFLEDVNVYKADKIWNNKKGENYEKIIN